MSPALLVEYTPRWILTHHATREVPVLVLDTTAAVQIVCGRMYNCWNISILVVVSSCVTLPF